MSVMAADGGGLAAGIEALRAVGRGQGSWQEAAREVCRMVGADAAAIIIWRGNRSDSEVEAQEGFGFQDGMVREYAQHYYQHDVLVQTHLPAGHWQVSNEHCPDSQWSRHPFFGDFLHRWRIRQIAALTLQSGDGRMAGLSLHRHTRASIVADDFHRGNLARLTREAEFAFEARYGTVVAARRALHTALSDSDSTAFLSDAAGRVVPLAPGHPVREMPPLMFRHGRVFHPVARARRRLQDLLRRAAAGQRARTAVPGLTGPLRVEAMPLPAQARLTANQELTLVRVLERGPSTQPEEGELAAYFGLTPAQARVLRLLCDGATATECAERLNCSLGTVRTHVAHLMLRMDCRRQAQLVRAAMMLMG